MSYHRALSDLNLNLKMGQNTSNNIESNSNSNSNSNRSCDKQVSTDSFTNENFLLESDLKIKKLHSDVTIPSYKTDGSSGMDLAAYFENQDKIEINPGETCLIKTGISVSFSKCLEIQIRPRSGLALKNSITVLNTPGTIDSDYTGEIGVILINHGNEVFTVNKGDRIAQMVLCPIIKANIMEVTELDETERGSGGFGSTGVTN